MMPNGKKRQDDRISLDPLTFDEALAGLLATDPPAKPTKQRKRANTSPTATPATSDAPKQKRATKHRAKKTP